ncbi:MAG: tetratricopeptide repeat protein, partial [Clostridiales bacterium]|nr:tetratricopeptide repeat protein [Clostridiales bacterium]
YPQALKWLRKALDIREKVLGKEHPDTAQSYNNIGWPHKNQGDYTQALVWCRKALDVFEKVLGPDHPHTKIVRENIDGLSR